MKHKYHIKKVTVSLLALICLFVLSIQAVQADPWWKEDGDWDWSYNNGARWSIEDYFKTNKDDAIRIGNSHFQDWNDYPANYWYSGFDSYKTKFTVDDRNAYGYVQSDSNGYIPSENYFITVNGHQYSVSIGDASFKNKNKILFSPIDTSWLDYGERHYVTLEVRSKNTKYHTYVVDGGYLYKSPYSGKVYLEFAVPFNDFGEYGEDVNRSTTWNFNQKDNYGDGIDFEGASTLAIIPVVFAVIFVGIGLRKNKKYLSNLRKVKIN